MCKSSRRNNECTYPLDRRKHILRKTISPLVPEDIITYAEPFGGAGWVLFYKDRWARNEVYNDLDSRLTNLFLQAKYHYPELLREISLTLANNATFNDFKEQNGFTEIQKAARFMYLIVNSYASKGDRFACGRTTPPPSCFARQDLLINLSKRLDKVIIENSSYEKILAKYDNPDTFFYLDPPYTKGHQYINAKAFSHEELAQNLKSLKARWLLSYNDDETVRKLYAGYNIIEVSRDNSMSNKRNEKYKEVIISNYVPEAK